MKTCKPVLVILSLILSLSCLTDNAEATYTISGGVHASVAIQQPGVSFDYMWDSGVDAIDSYFHDGTSGGLLIWRDAVCDAEVDGNAGAPVMPSLGEPVTPEEIAEYSYLYSIDTEAEYFTVIDQFQGVEVGIVGEIHYCLTHSYENPMGCSGTGNTLLVNWSTFLSPSEFAIAALHERGHIMNWSHMPPIDGLLDFDWTDVGDNPEPDRILCPGYGEWLMVNGFGGDVLLCEECWAYDSEATCENGSLYEGDFTLALAYQDDLQIELMWQPTGDVIEAIGKCPESLPGQTERMKIEVRLLGQGEDWAAGIRIYYGSVDVSEEDKFLNGDSVASESSLTWVIPEGIETGIYAIELRGFLETGENAEWDEDDIDLGKDTVESIYIEKEEEPEDDDTGDDDTWWPDDDGDDDSWYIDDDISPGEILPDDNYSIGPYMPPAGRLGGRSVVSAVILDAGLAKDFYQAAGSLGRAIPVMNLSQVPLLDPPPEFLIIASAGLPKFYRSPIARAWLASYVENGGKLLVLTQPWGHYYEALPRGNEMYAYGYVEDFACTYESAYAHEEHTLLAGQIDNLLNVNSDGYLSVLPTGTDRILDRTVSNQSAVSEYVYGQGRVFVTDMYTDFAYTHHQLQADERILFSNILSYLQEPDSAWAAKTFDVGQNIVLDFSVINTAELPSAQIEILDIDALGNIISGGVQNYVLPAGESATFQNLQIPASRVGSPGFHRIVYALLDEGGEEIQGPMESPDGHFVVWEDLEFGHEAADVQMWTISTQASGPVQEYDIVIKNNSGQTLEYCALEFRDDIGHGVFLHPFERVNLPDLPSLAPQDEEYVYHRVQSGEYSAGLREHILLYVGSTIWASATHFILPADIGHNIHSARKFRGHNTDLGLVGSSGATASTACARARTRASGT